MTDWLILGAYVLGWLASIRLAVWQRWWNPEQDCYLLPGFAALLWPLLAVITVAVLTFAGLVWLATAGVRRPS